MADGRASRRLAARLLAALLLSVPAAASRAQDFVLNVDDTGFDPVIAGAEVRYVATVAELDGGPTPATTLRIQVPAGLTFTGSSGSITGCAPAPPRAGPVALACDVPALAADGQATLTLVARATERGTRVLSAEVPTAGDADPYNNSQTEQTTVSAGADLAVDVSAPATAAAGSSVALAYAVTNNGPDPTASFVLQIPRPAGLSVTTPPAGCVLSGSTYQCTISTPLAAGARLTRTLTGQVAVAGGSTVAVLAAVVPGAPGDPAAANNDDSASVAVTPGSDLRVTKARSPSGTLTTGEAVTFTLASTFTGDVPNVVTLTDAVPAEYAVLSASGAGWSCSVSGQAVTCTRTGTGAAGLDRPLGTVTISARAAAVGAPTNQAQISANGPPDPNPGNNVGTNAATIQAPTVDLDADKSGPQPALAVVGSAYQFRLTATNLGTLPFFGTLVLTDELPAGFEATAIGGTGWTCPALSPPVRGPASISCTRAYASGAPLGVGAAAPVVTVTATAVADGSFTNAAVVSSPNANAFDPNPGNDRATTIIANSAGGASADVSAAKAASAAGVPAGDPITFTIEVVNAGPSASADIVVTDALSGLINNGQGATGQGLVGIVATPRAAGGLSCSSVTDGGTGRRLSCTIASLPVCTPGLDCPTIDVTVRPGGEPGARTNTANATSFTTADPTLGNNAGSVGYAVTPRADLDVVKAGAPSPVPAGQVLTYTVTARNAVGGQALSAAQGVELTDTLPADVAFLSATVAGGGACATRPAAGSVTGPGNDALVCALGTIASGGQRAVTVRVRPLTVLAGTTVTNRASVTTTTPEASTANNATTLATPVGPPQVDLQINKTDGPDPVTVGDLVTYTLVARNNGPSAAEDVVVTDTLPATRLAFDSVVPPAGGTCTGAPPVGTVGGTVACDVGDLASGAQAVVLVRLRGVAKGVTVNGASVSSRESAGGFETLPANNAVSENTTVRTRADMEVASKVATPSSITLPGQTTFVITVRNNAGTGLAEADGVVLSDGLPAGLRLRGTPTVSVVSGTVSAPSCGGAAGATSFACPVGTVSSGAVFEVSVPVDAFATSAQAQVITNTATVTTTSLDVNAANNSNSGSVVVSSSSVAGTIFRDFDDDGAVDGGQDTGIGGVTVRLTGTDLDGGAVSRVAATDASGRFLFAFLPAGTYSVRHDAIAEGYLVPGTNVPGSTGGTVAGPAQIDAIALGRDEAATGTLFPKVPQARVGVAKAVQGAPVVNPDGTFDVTFRLRVANPSLEPLSGVTVTDALAGAAPRFGALSASGAIPAGGYRVTGAPSGTCGGLNAGFDGSGDTTVLSGAALAAGATCAVDVTLRVNPAVPLPPVLTSGGRYENAAAVAATGALSGQAPATNPQLDDPSDDGASADADGDGQADEAGENDPTPVAPALAPAIALVKTADASGLSSPPRPGDVILYAFAVTNTGSVTLTDVTVTDPLAAVAGGPVTLLPGQSDPATFTASYVLTQADIDAGQVVNQATATARNGATVVTDPSGGAVGDDAPTTTPVARVTAVRLVKSLVAVDDANGSGRRDAGDVARYAFRVANAGNVRLGAVTVSDPTATVAGGPAVIEVGATDTATFTASRTLTQADVDRGYAQNSGTASARAVDASGTPLPAGGAPVAATDASDAGTAPDGSAVPAPEAAETPDGQGATNGDPGDDPTVMLIAPEPRLRLVKSVAGLVDANGSGRADAGDTVTYAFRVINVGNLALAGVTVTDPLVAVAGGPVDLGVGATDGGSFTATYVLTLADQARGYVENQATAQGAAVDGAGAPILAGGAPLTASDLSDAGTNPQGAAVPDPETAETPDGAGATDGDPAQDPTVARLAPSPALSLVKSVAGVTDATGDGLIGAGDVVAYAFSVGNVGNVALAGVVVRDPLAAVTGGPVDLPIGGSDAATFTAAYVLTQADVDRGFVENAGVATGTAVDGAGTPIPGPGGVPLRTTDPSDAGTDPAGAPVPAPEGTETPGGAGDTNGDPADDPTVTTLARAPALVLVKSVLAVEDANANGLRDAGDVVAYAFAVANRGNVRLAGVTVADPLVAVTGGPLNLLPGQADAGSLRAAYVLTQADLDRGFVQNSAVATGAAVSAGGAPILVGGAPLVATDISDAGTAPDGAAVADPAGTETPDGLGAVDADAGNDPTVALLGAAPRLVLVKSLVGVADTNGDGAAGVGDTATYAFSVANAGNVGLRGVTVADPLAAVAGGPVDLAPGATDAATFTAAYVVAQADVDRGFVENAATAQGRAVRADGTPVLDGADAPVTATDASDSGTRPDGSAVEDPAGTETPDGLGGTNGDAGDDPTVAPLAQVAALALVKTVDASNLSSPARAGEELRYAFAVTNTGNVSLRGVDVSDALPGIALAGGPVDLAPGETDDATFTATYALTEADVAAGTVANQASAAGSYGPGGAPLVTSDLSSDGAGEDGPTVVDFVGGVPGGLGVEKVADRGQAVRGETVGYAVTATNPADGVPVVVDVADDLPGGFAFVEGSARLDGAPVPAVRRGDVVVVEGVAIAPGRSVTVTLDVLVGANAGLGDHDNVAVLLDPAMGERVSEEARATVRVEAEPVFDCGTVIGRVYEDANGDGRFDAREDRAAITDQTYAPDGKWGEAPADAGGERGLPGVRLVAPDGLGVTTDAHGRFSVPCAMLPREGGSNFSLRLDERTLPAGFRVVTENPRVVVLTPGMLTEMSFGAAPGRVVRVDLSAAAFAGAEPSAALADGLRRMVEEVAAEPATLRVTYAAVAGEDGALARARLAAVERMVRGMWPAGRHALALDVAILRAAGTE